MGSTRGETEVRGLGSILVMEQVRNGHHCECSRNFGHRQDQSRESFPEDLGLGGKLNSGTRGRGSPVSKSKTQAWSKTMEPAELLQ